MQINDTFEEQSGKRIPNTYISEKMIEKDAEAAIKYLTKVDALDLVEVLGLNNI